MFYQNQNQQNQNPNREAIQKQFFNEPYYEQAKRMTEGKNKQQLEQTARNLCRERGLNFDETLSKFQSLINSIGG